jgi:hypothetical protein
VKAGKAYISSLGTTGLLVASSVLMLIVVGTIVGFDRWPAGSHYGSDTVAIGTAAQSRPARTVVTGRARARAERRRAQARLRDARARARLTRSGGGHRDAAPALDGTVVSGLPAPDSDPLGGGPMGGTPGSGSSVGTRSGGAPVGGGSQGGGPTRHVGDAVSQVSPDAGGTVGQVGQAVDQAVNESAPSIAP